jgi:hypothetical protein
VPIHTQGADKLHKYSLPDGGHQSGRRHRHVALLARRGRRDLVRVLAGDVAFERTYWLNLTSDMRMNPTIRAVRDFMVDQVMATRRLFQPEPRKAQAALGSS